MAIAVESASSAGAAGGDITVSAPAGVVNGNLLLAIGQADPDGTTFDAPAGWTQRGSTFAGSWGDYKWWTKTASSEPGSYTFTADGSAARVVTILRISGADTSNPIDVGPTHNELDTGSDQSSPSLTTLVAGDLLVCTMTLIIASSATITAPAGMTERTNTTDPSGWIRVGVATEILGAAGSTGTRQWTHPSRRWASGSIAIRAAAAGITQPVGTATETDTAQALARRTARPIGIATETDTAPAVTRRKARTLGIAGETDAAQALGGPKIRTLGIAGETAAAQPLTRRKSRTVGIAGETDTAPAVTRRKTRQLGIAATTDVALQLRRVKRRALGIAAEVDTARAVVKAGPATTGVFIWDGAQEVPAIVTIWTGTQEVPTTVEVVS